MLKSGMRFFLMLLIIALAASGCSIRKEPLSAEPEKSDGKISSKPAFPKEIVLVNGIPEISVYNIATKQTETMDLEVYIQGVLAGEMNNDWPMEALKAQAILARTFVLNFISEKDSMYPNADISTDIKEAQAYRPEKINDRILDAVNQTAGLVLTHNGEFPQAWFHAHAGGTTELPGIALDYTEADPSYTRVLTSPDSDKAPDSVKAWKASFSFEDIEDACEEMGINTGEIVSFEIGARGESGRVADFVINGKKVSAPALRLQLGSSKMKSTLLTNIVIHDSGVSFEGSGYGHGVGLSQWGAYAMAESGDSAAKILAYYYPNTEIVDLY